MEKEFAQRFIRKHKIHYPIVDGESSVGLQATLQQQYEWQGILPYTLVIHNKVTEYSYAGRIDYQELHQDIPTLIPTSNSSKRLATSKP